MVQHLPDLLNAHRLSTHAAHSLHLAHHRVERALQRGQHGGRLGHGAEVKVARQVLASHDHVRQHGDEEAHRCLEALEGDHEAHLGIQRAHQLGEEVAAARLLEGSTLVEGDRLCIFSHPHQSESQGRLLGEHGSVHGREAAAEHHEGHHVHDETVRDHKQEELRRNGHQHARLRQDHNTCLHDHGREMKQGARELASVLSDALIGIVEVAAVEL
mmetsp:Transcript_115710/g.367960  ORF Transcript_115710/g.367960 Transcript_115710/m.367960 type:complete len:215 (-) Transcript_115710:636-1280(-)